MKIGISHWQGRISPVLDVSGNLVLVETADGEEIGRTVYRLTSHGICRRVREISGIGMDVLICGAVSFLLEAALSGKGIHVVSFVFGDMEVKLREYLSGNPDREAVGPPV